MLIDLNVVKWLLWITDNSQDAILEMYYDKSISIIENITQAIIEEKNITKFFTWFNWNILNLWVYPINSVSSVSYNTGWDFFNSNYVELVNLQDYKVKEQTWEIYIIVKYCWFDEYKVSFSAWYTNLTVPKDINNLIIDLIIVQYNENQAMSWRDLSIKSESVNWDSITFVSWSELDKIWVNNVLSKNSNTLSKYTVFTY